MKTRKFAQQAQEMEDLLKRTGWDLNELSRKTGYNVRTLANAASGTQKLSDSRMKIIRDVCSVPVYAASALREDGPVGEPERRLRLIPVVSWTKAGEADDFEDLPSEWMRRVASDAKDARAFGVDIIGDSMEPKFSQGDTAILTPSERPRNGDLVVARLRDEGVLFKLYHSSGDRIKLTSYNVAFPEQDFQLRDFSWIYPVDHVIKNTRRY